MPKQPPKTWSKLNTQNTIATHVTIESHRMFLHRQSQKIYKSHYRIMTYWCKVKTRVKSERWKEESDVSLSVFCALCAVSLCRYTDMFLFASSAAGFHLRLLRHQCHHRGGGQLWVSSLLLSRIMPICLLGGDSAGVEGWCLSPQVKKCVCLIREKCQVCPNNTFFPLFMCPKQTLSILLKKSVCLIVDLHKHSGDDGSVSFWLCLVRIYLNHMNYQC